MIAALNLMPASASPVADEKGVMMYDYGDKVVYNPKVVAAEGLRYFSRYKKSGGIDFKSRQYFINTAEWLVANATLKGNYSLWEYNFEWSAYGGLAPPYVSALAQSEGIDVLIKAHEITKDDRYLESADRAFNSFLVDYEEGGVASAEKNGTVFLQILAKQGFTKTYVLNGHTASLLHLWRYYSYTHDGRVKGVFDRGIRWLRDNISKYDAGDWSYYDQMGIKASTSYHIGQTKQLYYLYQLTGEAKLKEYADRFDRYSGLGLASATMPVWK